MTSSAPVRDASALSRAFARPKIMGVINLTPDSFHEGSRAASVEAAVAAGLRMAEEGADLIDLGGQSTRPGSDAVAVETELERVVPVVAALAKKVKVPLSVDTDKSAVAAAAFDAGATVLNDVCALRGPGMLKAALRFERVVLMHMLGDSPKTMQKEPRYGDCVGEVSAFLRARLDAFLQAGGRRERVLVDPGVGFGKTLAHNLELIRGVPELAKIAPVLLGVSRKSMFAKISPDAGPQDRLAGSLAVVAWASLSGAAMLRVHDVAETKRALDVLEALAGGGA